MMKWLIVFFFNCDLDTGWFTYMIEEQLMVILGVERKSKMIPEDQIVIGKSKEKNSVYHGETRTFSNHETYKSTTSHTDSFLLRLPE